MSIIPTPTEAAQLRVLYVGHPIVDRAEQALRNLAVGHVRQALELLPMWAHYSALTDRERRAVLARFVPVPATHCARCGAAVRYVNDGPDPGWWTHTDIDAMLASTQHAPHPPVIGGVR